MNQYDKRGVSADKSEVHEAIKKLDKGLYPNSFCKVLPDYLGGDDNYVNIVHADTAGTKTSLAYMYWKETGNLNIWKGIAQDAIVMNIDDIACTGITNNFIISSTIGRNKSLIPGEVIQTLISANQEYCQYMSEMGFQIVLAGGETADVGDIVRTIDVGITAVARAEKHKIKEIRIKPGDVIIGLGSEGNTSYDKVYNSGIGSNGLTFARHELLDASYKKQFPESFDPSLPDEVVYTGHKKLTDVDKETGLTIGELLLSPTRSYLPVLDSIWKKFFNEINGIIHCTGGGQTKVLHFIDNVRIVKNNLFQVPPVFRLIQEQNNTSWHEMYRVFNMGHRIEIYCSKEVASDLIKHISQFDIPARQIGFCEKSNRKKLIIIQDDLIIEY